MEITVLSGLPASGKTTYTNCYGPDTIVVHRDEWRAAERDRMGSSEYYPFGDAKREYTHWMDYLVSVIRANPGKNFCIDQTTLSNGAALKLLKGLYSRAPEIFDKNLYVRIIALHTPTHVCMERNAKRTGHARVPDEVMRSMADSFHISEKGLRLMLTTERGLCNLHFEVFHFNDLLAY